MFLEVIESLRPATVLHFGVQEVRSVICCFPTAVNYGEIFQQIQLLPADVEVRMVL